MTDPEKTPPSGDKSSPERWSRLEELFQAALEKEPEEREAFLAQACGDDDTLRREVESLIAADQEARRFMEEPAYQPPTGVLDQEGHLRHQERLVGAYKLVHKIGEGGMSTVYLAVRADAAYRRRAAIKLLRVGIDSEESLGRFRTERQILAGLDHPNIARLLDGGTTEEGLPYLVMEYIEGVPIDKYCDQHGLSIRKRVELFRKVCSAVHYAHQNLVVHRDLKPSNILVRADGEPKLLDFGIAKLLNPELLGQHIDPTRFDARLMTPQYASPEQVRGDAITTPSDVYSLGVLLYRLLTGRFPYRLENRPLPEIARIICEQEPSRTSRAVLRREPGEPTTEEVSLARRTTPGKLQRLLSGDLDNIVLKALRKEPERRYASVEQFSEDLHRHLVGHPVIATHDTLAYRAQKFVRRHRIGVAFAALLVTVLVAFGATMAVQSRRIAQGLEEAEREAAKAKAINEFLQETLGSADPVEGVGREISVLEALERAVDKIDASFADEEETEAAVRRTIGTTYRALGRYDEAEKLLSGALAIRRRVLPADHPDVAESVIDLALLLQNKGELGKAVQLIREAVLIRRHAYANSSPEVAETLGTLGSLLRQAGRYDEGEAVLRQALAMGRQRLGDGDPALAKILRELAALLADRAQDAAAEDLYREALDILARAFSGGHPEIAAVLNNLAIVTARRDLVAAEQLYRQALEMRRELLGEEHPATAITLSNLAGLLFDRGEYDAAEELLEEALRIHRTILADEHPESAGYLSNLAGIQASRGEYGEAEELLLQALAIQRRVLGDRHPDSAGYRRNLAALLARKGDYEAAEQLLEEALSIHREVLGEGHPEVVADWKNLASVLLLKGNYEEAERLLRQALATEQSLFGGPHPATATTLLNLGSVLGRKGDLEGARQLYEEAWQVNRESLGVAHPSTALAMEHLAEVLREQGDDAAAAELFRKTIEVYRRSLGVDHSRVAHCRSDLGASLTALGSYGDAEVELRAGLAGLRSALGEGHPLTQQAAQRLADLYEVWGKPQPP